MQPGPQRGGGGDRQRRAGVAVADRGGVLVRAARKGRRFHPAARSPLTDLLASVLSGGTVSLCTQCAARRDIAPEDVIPGVRIAGASTFVAEVMADGAQALVY